MSQLIQAMGKPYETKVAWGQAPSDTNYHHGELRLIVRMLPLSVPEQYRKSRADSHLWPKGTFIQFNGRPMVTYQRRQQSHNPLEWKGLSRPLDLTALMLTNKDIQELKLCSYDENIYGIQVALCEYFSPEKLFELCLHHPTLQGERSLSIHKLTYQEGLEIGLRYVDNTTMAISLDDDIDNDRSAQDCKLTHTHFIKFGLLCPFSQLPMVTPVRGIHCKHMQCFDLRNYLESNKAISGTRWRCGVCEGFIAVRDLVVDGFCLKILDDVKDQVNSDRETVELFQDGTWKLSTENRLRCKGRRDETRGSITDETQQNKRIKVDYTSNAIDVIDLL
jgi:hypothetical protein